MTPRKGRLLSAMMCTFVLLVAGIILSATTGVPVLLAVVLALVVATWLNFAKNKDKPLTGPLAKPRTK